jgi:CheY-like chemotaxis protein
VATPSVRILVVDDYEPWRRVISRTLEKQPELQIIGEVTDGLEAVHKGEELGPDLVLLDIGLPHLDGIEAARRLRTLSPQSKIIFVSQWSSADLVHGRRRLRVQNGCGGQATDRYKRYCEGNGPQEHPVCLTASPARVRCGVPLRLQTMSFFSRWGSARSLLKISRFH